MIHEPLASSQAI